MNDDDLIFEAYQNIYESVTFSVDGGNLFNVDNINNINDLGTALLYGDRDIKGSSITEFIKSNLSEQEFEEWKNNKIYEFITMDGSEFEAAEGNINFYTVGFPEKIIPKVISFIKYFIGEYNFKLTSEPYKERSNLHESDVIRFPVQIVTNKESENIPEVNLSNRNASIILINILKYPESVLEDHQINSRELLMKIENIEDNEKKLKSYVVKNVNDRFTVLGLSEERIKRILFDLKKLAQYAVDNHFTYIKFG
jgi:hypothetical protein